MPPTVFAVFLPLVMLVGFAAGPLLGLGWGRPCSPSSSRSSSPRCRRSTGPSPRPACSTSPSAPPSGWPPGCSPGRAAAPVSCTAPPRPTWPPAPGWSGRPSTSWPAAAAPARAARGPRGRRARLGLVGAVPDRAPPAAVGRLAGDAARRAPRRPRGRGSCEGSVRPGGLLPCVEALHDRDRTTSRPGSTGSPAPSPGATGPCSTAPPPDPPRTDWPTNLGADLYHLADLHVWLDGLRDDLARIPVDTSSGRRRRRRRAARPERWACAGRRWTSCPYRVGATRAGC